VCEEKETNSKGVQWGSAAAAAEEEEEEENGEMFVVV
jgi:hypothetical protein